MRGDGPQHHSCSRTKTKGIVTLAVAPTANIPVAETCAKQNLVSCVMRSMYFSIVMQFWNESLGNIVTYILAMSVCNVTTGRSLFYALES